MHVDLLSTTKGSPKIIHATENGKKTGCGINLVKPENIGMFTNAGQMTDVVQITCEKCKTNIAKRLIRESNKELAAQLKEEQRQLKRERAASKHHNNAAVPPPVSPASSSSSKDGGYIPPSMRKAAPPPPSKIETPSPMPAPVPSPAQFAVPSVPSSLPTMVSPAPAPVPVAQTADDVLAQFAVPSVPSSLPTMTPPAPAPVPAAQTADDVLAQFAVPSVSPSQDLTNVSGSSVKQDDILAQFMFKQPSNPTTTDADMTDVLPSATSGSADPLADLLLMPEEKTQNHLADTLPDIANVPSSIPSIPTSPVDAQQSEIPTLNVPPAPPAPPAPAMPVPPVLQEFSAPAAAQTTQNTSVQNQQFNPFAVPSAPKSAARTTHMPLFVGYSADGRQLFQTYDDNGNPIPLNEPVYSVPPEQKDNNIAVKVAAMASNSAANGNAPIMELDDIMASMGIADPRKPKKEEGKAINFTEYKIPDEKKKKKTASKPASAIATPVPEGPISAAEAKRRKKVEKINKEFEKQLRSRGIDPKTGSIMIDPRK